MADATLDGRAISAGIELTSMTIDVTPTVVAAGAIATRDFMPVHHDKAYAQTQGAPDIFMNILSITGYCTRFLTDWAGPDAMVRKLAIRLGAPVIPGVRLAFGGRVDEVSSERDEEAFVEVSFEATSALGTHVSGTATLGVPVR